MKAYLIDEVNKRVQKVETLLKELTTLTESNNFLQKEILDFKEAYKYLRISDSLLYKLKHRGEMPFLKPNGGKLYFRRSDLDNWLSRDQVISEKELDKRASTIVQELNKDERLAK